MSAAWTFNGVSALQGKTRVLHDVSLAVQPGEVVGILGPNGAGKTTLLRAGLGLTPIESGEVHLGERPLHGLSPGDRSRLAGYLPQERRVGWNLAAWQVASLGAPHLAAGAAEAAAREALGRVGLANLADRGVLEMSGGERARALLARLLVTGAPLLAADEPVAGLDPDAQLLTLELLRAEAEKGVAVVVTLHDLTLAARTCDRLIILHDGHVVGEGPPRQALSPEVLAAVFGLDGGLHDTMAGLVLAARRVSV
ncbi:MAG: transporter related [Caulobacter sp.]|nr:transporter related [Caulobacter sp.]